jgi:AraC-like DNA-binding protein
MPRDLINLPGLAGAVRLKMDLLGDLSRHSTEEWPGHIDRFIDRLAALPLDDVTALRVLLADLIEAIRTLLGREDATDADNREQRTDPELAALSKREILVAFRAQIGELLRQVTRPQQPLSRLVARMVSLIEERYDEPVTLQFLAAELGRSKRHLANLFHLETGQTVHRFLTQVRVHHAASMIRSGGKIEAISLLVGYRSKKNFYLHFKREIGVTPKAYRTAVVGLTRPSESV